MTTPVGGPRGAHAEPVGSIVAGFAARLMDTAWLNSPTQLPSGLAIAAAETFHADGAVISLLCPPTTQMPIGSSSADAALAEQLQFTLNDGPALDSQRIGLPVLANADTASVCWAAFYQELRRRTPFTAIGSIPLPRGRSTIGVLDLYFVRPLRVPGFPIDAAQLIGALITDSLVVTRYLTDSNDLGPSWLINHATQPRGQLSIAMGAVCVHRDVNANYALRLIRGYAATHGGTVDEVAHQLTHGTLTPHQLDDRSVPRTLPRQTATRQSHDDIAAESR